MGFTSFSSEQIINNNTSVDNSFINDFLPVAPENMVKVYLFGLYNCNVNTANNTLSDFARILNLTEEQVIEAYDYWKEMGLVQIIKTDPISIRYLPVKYSSSTLMKFDKKKYKDFNVLSQEMITGRQLTPSEYQEYYYLMESLHIEQDALLMIIKYCVDLKGKSVGYKYILTVAKNWSYQGINTAKKVEEKLLSMEASDSDMKLVLKAIGSKRTPKIDDYELFVEWTKELGFELDVILTLAKKVKQKKGGLNKLNSWLNKFYSLRLMSVKEIESYLEQEQALYDIAKMVCRNIGVRYDNLDVVVETYVNQWISYGYDYESLSFVSLHAFKTGIKTLQGVNSVLSKFYKLGLVTMPSITDHLKSSIEQDKKIGDILTKLGIVRHVNMYDREFYKTWIYTWGLSQELIDYAITLSCNKSQPMQYLNKILSTYHVKKIETVEQAKQQALTFASQSSTKKAVAKAPSAKSAKSSKSYSKDELNALFASVEEVVI